jgi:hypothetical protein
MYVTPKQKKQTFIITALLVVLLPILIYATYLVTSLIINASKEAIPTNIIISNITSTSATITYYTDVDSLGTITYKKDGATSNSSPVSDSRGVKNRKTHYFELSGLDPNSEYSFEITSANNVYAGKSTNTVPLAFKTANLSEVTPVPNPVFGEIVDFTGDDAIVYFFVPTSGSKTLPLTSTVRDGGNWITDLSGLLQAKTLKGVTVDADTELTIVVLTGDVQSAVVTGTISDLFDDTGKLLESVEIVLKDGTDAMAEIPDEAIVGTLVEGNIVTVTPTISTSITPTPSVTPTLAPTPIFDPTKREFRIYSDPKLVDIIVPDDSINAPKPNVTTGVASVQITNVTDTRFTVVWLSATKEEGYVKYGTSASSLTAEATDTRDGALEKNKYYSHQVDVTKLTADTKYYFEIYSGSQKYQSSGKPFEQRTFVSIAGTATYKSVSGKVTNLADMSDSVIVISVTDKDGTGSAGSSTKSSTIPSSTGSWIASIGESRLTDGSAYFNITSGDQLIASMVAYAESLPVTKQTDSLETTIVTIAAKDLPVAQDSTKVPALGSYGVYTTIDDLLKKNNATNYNTGESVQGVSTTSINEISGQVLGATTIPKTGVLDWWLLGVGSSLIVVFWGFKVSSLFVVNKTKNRKKTMHKVLSV